MKICLLMAMWGVVAVFFMGCDGDEACYGPLEVKTCADYSHMLLSCHSEDYYPNLPGCEVVEHCTDYSAITDTTANTADSDSDSHSDSETTMVVDSEMTNDSESESESETPQTGVVCEKVCEGNLLPCEKMGKKQCQTARHCEWFDDSSSI
ncbi:MAG: hypothetical protein JXR76_04030 [Deltaproteobacteria bacterium]|nr:hypothetical protein [Deltaproteobacteria bacterium]